jgi:hypothetical protein
MKPIDFKESTKVLHKPESMSDEECYSMAVFCDGKNCISKWTMSWKERLHCFIRGYVWVWVLSGNTQPPISVSSTKTVFEYFTVGERFKDWIDNNTWMNFIGRLNGKDKN